VAPLVVLLAAVMYLHFVAYPSPIFVLMKACYLLLSALASAARRPLRVSLLTSGEGCLKRPYGQHCCTTSSPLIMSGILRVRCAVWLGLLPITP
jgi:hypothetical protein